MPKGVWKKGRPSDAERFEAFCVKDFCEPKTRRGGIQTLCWNWTGHIDEDGYGGFSYTQQEPKKHISCRATRFSWFLTHGKWPDYQMNHLCSNRFCCNPEHLYDGTHPENVADALEDRSYKPTAGTWAKGDTEGEKNGRAKLTNEDVALIKKDILEATEYGSLKKVAKEWDIPYQNVQKIKEGRMWASVPWPDGKAPSFNGR